MAADEPTSGALTSGSGTPAPGALTSGTPTAGTPASGTPSSGALTSGTPAVRSPAIDALAARLRDMLGPGQVLTDRQQLRTYECDGLAQYRVVPALVVLPRTAGQVAAVVRACADGGVPFVARGSGTGLSGGALPHADGVLIVTSQLRDILAVRPADERAVVQPGVINLQVSRAAEPYGYYYAPDPSSQQICSIGGNVAENAGGAHCLKYGFTTNHVTGLEIVTADGELVRLGGDAPDTPGYDLLGAFVGSEGTLGIATEVTVRLTRLPATVRTLLAAFRTVDQASAATSAIIAAGVVPAAVEMMDALAVEAAEAAVHCDYPAGAGAVLIVELDGPAAEVQAQFEQVTRLCDEAGAFETRVAADDTERQLIWRGRKSAFAAVGRISPNYLVQDGVIPRTALPEVLRRIGEVAGVHGFRVANVFHAGDGNLHPLVLFDDSRPGEAERAESVSGAILELCIEHGGSITGEHGVGMDKSRYMPLMFSADDLETMHLVRCAFDPDGLANPGKVFPTPRLCGERPGVHSGAHPLQEAGLGEVF
ncbi:FAD-binding protein [Actinoplanes sp. NBRC 101535]|nr:FAD-linked oxidase C-terminal domain-containing protein [Actinoplanes sp. NBRC 101535]GLY00607.1 FAD-binding protein [Actinoplanes sp. NBRC 101535]